MKPIMTTTADLPAETRAAGFSLLEDLPGGPTFVFTGYGKFDLSKLSVESATQLVEAGCRWIVKAEEPQPKAKELKPDKKD